LQRSSIDKERRGASNAETVTFINITLQADFMDTLRQAGFELCDIESDLWRIYRFKSSGPSLGDSVKRMS